MKNTPAPDAPRCLWCEKKPVKRFFHIAERHRYRCIDGQYWRNFCSKTCAGESWHAGISEDTKARHRQRFIQWNNRRRATLFISTMREKFPGFTDGDPVTAKQLLAFGTTCYRRGWHARNQRAVKAAKEERLSA